MSITGSIIVYVMIWWVVFFSVLPVGIKSQNTEFKDDLQGNDPGAPKNPEIIDANKGRNKIEISIPILSIYLFLQHV